MPTRLSAHPQATARVCDQIVDRAGNRLFVTRRRQHAGGFGNEGFVDSVYSRRDDRLAGEKRRLKETPLFSLRRVGLFLERWATGFGYRMRLAFGWALLLLLAGWVVFQCTGQAIGQALSQDLVHPAEYSLDLLLPLVKLRDAHYTKIDLRGPARWYFHGHQLAGTSSVTSSSRVSRSSSAGRGRDAPSGRARQGCRRLRALLRRSINEVQRVARASREPRETSMIFVPPNRNSDGEKPMGPMLFVLLIGAVFAGSVVYRKFGGEFDFEGFSPAAAMWGVAALGVLIAVIAGVVALRQNASRDAEPSVDDRLTNIEQQIGRLREAMDAELDAMSTKVDDAARTIAARGERRS